MLFGTGDERFYVCIYVCRSKRTHVRIYMYKSQVEIIPSAVFGRCTIKSHDALQQRKRSDNGSEDGSITRKKNENKRGKKNKVERNRLKPG